MGLCNCNITAEGLLNCNITFRGLFDYDFIYKWLFDLCFKYKGLIDYNFIYKGLCDYNFIYKGLLNYNFVSTSLGPQQKLDEGLPNQGYAQSCVHSNIRYSCNVCYTLGIQILMVGSLSLDNDENQFVSIYVMRFCPHLCNCRECLRAFK